MLCKGLLKLFAVLCCCGSSDERSIADEEDQRPLLSRTPPPTPPMPIMPRPKTYGRRPPKGRTRTDEIFGGSDENTSPRSGSPLGDITDKLNGLHLPDAKYGAESDTLSPSSSDDPESLSSLLQHKSKVSHGSRNDANKTIAGELSALTAVLVVVEPGEPRSHKVEVIDQDSSVGESSLRLTVLSIEEPDEPQVEDEDVPDEDSDVNDYPSFSSFGLDPTLQPIIDFFQSDCNKAISVNTWNDILPDSMQIEKIAEASFSEVFRIKNSEGSSIIKVMRIKVEADHNTEDLPTAIMPEVMLSELRIMNVAEAQGFVVFKDCYLVRGKSNSALCGAYSHYLQASDGESDHPDPREYVDESMFLVIELGDAGTVLEDLVIEDVGQLWDVMIGVVMALAAGEQLFEFEHRDLHENNICYRVSHPTAEQLQELPEGAKYGRSGISLTLIDYGLSRATLLDGSIIYNDLDQDMGLFQGDHKMLQFETYRRMRTYQIKRKRTHERASLHEAQPAPNEEEEDGLRRWDAYSPYSNVLWVRYLLDWARSNFEYHVGKLNSDLRQYNEDMKEFEHLLKPFTRPEKGAFVSARGMLEYMVEKGWVTEEQWQDFGFVAADASIIGN